MADSNTYRAFALFVQGERIHSRRYENNRR